MHEKHSYNLCPVCGYDCKVPSNYMHWGWPDTTIFNCLTVEIKNNISYRYALKKLFTKLHMLNYFLALRKFFKSMKYTRQGRIKMDLTSFNDFINDSNFDTIRVAVTLRSDRVI